MRNPIFLAFLLTLISFSCNRKTAAVATPSEPPARPAVRQPNPEEIAESPIMEEGAADTPSRIAGGNPAAMRTPEALAAAKANPEVIAEFRQFPCADDPDCPDFSLRIMNDFSLRFEGRANVDLIGLYSGRTPFDPMSRLSPLASAVNFYGMDKVYPAGEEKESGRLVKQSLEVKWWGRRNRVEYFAGREENPEGLEEMEAYLRALIEQAIWTPITE